MTIKINDLDRDKVLPQKKQVRDLCNCQTCDDAGGFNDCVSKNDRLTIEIDEDRLMEEIGAVDCLVDIDEYSTKEQIEVHWMNIAKHLKSTIKTWARIGLEK